MLKHLSIFDQCIIRAVWQHEPQHHNNFHIENIYCFVVRKLLRVRQSQIEKIGKLSKFGPSFFFVDLSNMIILGCSPSRE